MNVLDKSILTGQTSSLPGYSSLPYDIGKERSIMAWMQSHGTTYGLGCKVADLSASPPSFITPSGQPINEVDCSGYQRYATLHAGGLLLPDGSVNQLDFLAAHGFKHHAIVAGQDYTADLAANVVYLCFCRTGSRGEGIGHVWGVYGGPNGSTFESHGGSGPATRSPQASILTHICTDVFAIARLP